MSSQCIVDGRRWTMRVPFEVRAFWLFITGSLGDFGSSGESVIGRRLTAVSSRDSTVSHAVCARRGRRPLPSAILLRFDSLQIFVVCGMWLIWYSFHSSTNKRINIVFCLPKWFHGFAFDLRKVGTNFRIQILYFSRRRLMQRSCRTANDFWKIDWKSIAHLEQVLWNNPLDMWTPSSNTFVQKLSHLKFILRS